MRLASRFTALAFASLAMLAAPKVARATDPVLRYQADVHGDVVSFGSTLGFDCGSGVAPPPGTATSCVFESNTDDTAPDVYWRDNLADSTWLPTQARTSATLVLPAGATVKYARLYWAALTSGATVQADPSVVLDFLGGPQQVVNADQSWTLPYGFPSHPDWFYYQSSGDITDYVQTWGAGDFRITDVDALDLIDLVSDRSFAAWTIVVVYEAPNAELRNVALFDGFTPIDPGMPNEASAQVTLNGFLVPPGFTAKMTAITYEGDAAYTGDHFTLNGTQLTDAQNPADNFFNSSRSSLGQPVSGAFDVPALDGTPGSMAGYDLDTVDVTSLLHAGDTSCVVAADSNQDIFFLGGFVTSVTNKSPDLQVTKTVVDLNGNAVVPNDVLEYTVTATNDGNDAAVNAHIDDVIQTGLTFVPGSLQILQGPNPGTKTDQKDGDEAEYVAGTNTITFHMGTINAGSTVSVKFRLKVTAASGTLTNQASLTAAGSSGAPPKTWLSDGDPNTIGNQPTTSVIDECNKDADCTDPTKPVCDLTTHVCIGCSSDGDCKDPTKPACQPNGSCGQCSDSNDTQCMGQTPFCDTQNGICVLCTLGMNGNSSACMGNPNGPTCVSGGNNTVHCGCTMDSDCGGTMSGKVCDTIQSICIDGCRGIGGNGCPTGDMCTSMDTSIGACVMSMTTTSSSMSTSTMMSTSTTSMSTTSTNMSGTGGTSSTMTSMSTSTNGGGGADSSGASGDNPNPGDNGGCGCSVPGERETSNAPALLGLAIAIAFARKKRSLS